MMRPAILRMVLGLINPQLKTSQLYGWEAPAYVQDVSLKAVAAAL